jgi:hypothetical protein
MASRPQSVAGDPERHFTNADYRIAEGLFTLTSGAPRQLSSLADSTLDHLMSEHMQEHMQSVWRE